MKKNIFKKVASLALVSVLATGSLVSNNVYAANVVKKYQGEFEKYNYDANKVYDIEWCVNEVNAPTDENANIKVLLEKRFGVKFKIWYVDRAKREELLNIRFTSGQFPDVLTSSGALSTANYFQQGLTMELPVKMLQAVTPKIYTETMRVAAKDKISPFVVTNVTGKNVGIPNFNYNGKYHYSSLWRKDWLDALGIKKTPETIAEFETAFYAVKDNKQKLISAGLTKQKAENIYALSSGRIQEPFASIYGAYGYLPYFWNMNDKNEIVYGAVQPEMKTALTTLSKWYKDGILNPEFITGENRGDHWSISHDMVEGRIIYTNNGPYYQNIPAKISTLVPKGGRMFRAFVAANPAEALADGRPPIGPDGKSGSVIWGTTTGSALVLSKKLEKQPDKVGRILSMIDELCTNQADYTLLNYGVQGVHWNYLEDGVTKKSIVPETDSVEKYGLGVVFAAWGDSMGLVRQDDPKYFAYGDKVALYSKDYRDVLMGVKLKSHDRYWDELEKMRIQFYNDVITGKKPVSDFDKFTADWLKRGGEQISKEANEWYKAATK